MLLLGCECLHFLVALCLKSCQAQPPKPLELLKEAVRTMPNAGFLQAYGMTETAGTISILPPEDHVLEGNERMRSAGKAVPGAEIEVRGPDNKEVPLGEIGEVCVRSPSNTAGYWQLPEATRDTIDEDGWLKIERGQTTVEEVIRVTQEF